MPAPRTTLAASQHDDFEGPGGWRAAISKEVHRVFVQDEAIKLVPISDYHEMLALNPAKVSYGHIVLTFRAKAKPAGAHDEKRRGSLLPTKLTPQRLANASLAVPIQLRSVSLRHSVFRCLAAWRWM